MKRVVIESPYAGAGTTPEEIAAATELNLQYLRVCLRDSFLRGEAPFASHGLYTQPGVLDDTISTERTLGIDAGFAWRECAELTVVYSDLGITRGMQFGIADAAAKGRPVVYRTLGENLRTALGMANARTEHWAKPVARATFAEARELGRAGHGRESTTPVGPHDDNDE